MPSVNAGGLRRIGACLLVLISVLSGLSATAARAATAGPTFALKVTGSSASYFVLPGKPGGTLTGEVNVLNVGGRSGGVSLYATDATTGQTSGVVYRSPQEPRRDVGAWLALAVHHLTLAPGQSQNVPFRVSIPAGVRPGQHLGGIVASPDVPRARVTHKRGRATFHIQVRALTVIAVEVNLPGPRIKRLGVTGIGSGSQPGYQTLLIGLTSTGTALTKGTGTLSVIDGHGTQRVHRFFSLDTFVPGSAIQYPVQVLGKALPAGQYHATVKLAYAGHRVSRTMPFSITGKDLIQSFGSRHTAPPSGSGQSMIPWLIGGIALALAAFALGARVRTRGAA